MYQEFHKKHSTSLSRKILYHLAKSKVYWPNMEKYIKFFIGNKCPCLASKQHIAPHAPLGTVTLTSPMDIIAIDFLKVDRAAGGYEYILVIIISSLDMQRHMLLQTILQKLPLKNFSMILCSNSERQIESYTVKERNSKANCLMY